MKSTPAPEPFRKVLIGAALFFLICLLAVAGYMAAGWKLADSVYMVVITIFGVGYGEVQPIESFGLRVLTISVIVLGYGALIYIGGGFLQMLIDGELNRSLGARRMTKELEQVKNHTILCGVGRMGSMLARELHAAGKPFVVIDRNERRLQEAAEAGYLIIDGDATEESILEQAGIHRAATVATVLSEDALNLFVTITAREMNPQLMIIARGENPRTEKKLRSSGADRVILPTAIGAAKVAQLIIRPSAENLLEQITHQSSVNEELDQIGLQFEEIQVTADSQLVEKTLGDIEVRGNQGFLIVGVRSEGGKLLLNPSPSTPLAAGDTVIVLGHHDDIPQLEAKFKKTAVPIMYRGVAMNG
ncbi:potassium channel family protein [Adhaeretor mobilis]|uniref:Ktr system potassium uptake protein A n=1 Tax=Adhaeretor mobilis TaxID=1930276 RepID=A0A517N2N1_9BACT|nr:potassium channel protein [Adhaeretor mobilis]QDT01399.1 Ktr system potassium uptake protein A [Adhaeretor mobilis]